MSTINPTSPLVSDDLAAIAAEQRRELVAAKSLDADLDFAYNLQLQEAITASLGLDHHQPSSSSAAVTHPILDEGIPTFTDLLSEELLSLEQEIKDQAVSVSEFEKLKDDLHRRIHDHRVAMEIARIPEDEWENWGDDFERPFGEGSSKGVNSEIFRVYFKGLVENDVPKGSPVGGIGVAICDSSDGLLFQLRKQLMASETSRPCAEMLALVEGLTAALELDLKRVEFYCDYYPIFQYVTGKWSAKHRRKVSALLAQISHLQEKFTYCQPLYVPRNDIKFAFKLAREAAISAVSNAAESSGSRDSQETCVICLEDTNSHQMFSVDNCMHRYCFACMKQHVEVKLLHGMLPICPHEKCQTALKVDSCSKFLTPRLMEIMSHRIKEASIPVDDIIYCPYPKCSALMSKNEVLEYSKASVVGAERLGARKCMKCNNLFCINCKVPWHNNMTCNHYKWRYPNTHIEEARLKNLATANLWRQCVKCNHMIELAAGCYHMTCRCGYEFCYTCGAEWKNKEATCSCPLWDENYIIEDEDDFLFDENEFDEYEEEDEEEEEEY